MREFEEFIKDLIYKDETAGDILRVLSLFGGALWMEEIKWEIQSMNSTLGLSREIEDLSDKIMYMADNGILDVDRRIKGSMFRENVEDNLVRLKNVTLIRNILSGDEKLLNYIRIRREAYRRG